MPEASILTSHQLAKRLLSLPDLKVILLKPNCSDEYEYLSTTILVSGSGEDNIALKGESYIQHLKNIGKLELLDRSI